MIELFFFSFLVPYTDSRWSKFSEVRFHKAVLDYNSPALNF